MQNTILMPEKDSSQPSATQRVTAKLRCHCGQKLTVPIGTLGYRGRCPFCGRQLVLDHSQPYTAVDVTQPLPVADRSIRWATLIALGVLHGLIVDRIVALPPTTSLNLFLHQMLWTVSVLVHTLIAIHPLTPLHIGSTGERRLLTASTAFVVAFATFLPVILYDTYSAPDLPVVRSILFPLSAAWFTLAAINVASLKSLRGCLPWTVLSPENKGFRRCFWLTCWFGSLNVVGSIRSQNPLRNLLALSVTNAVWIVTYVLVFRRCLPPVTSSAETPQSALDSSPDTAPPKGQYSTELPEKQRPNTPELPAAAPED